MIAIANKAAMFITHYAQAEEEMRRKVELIQQIRAMESVPVIRTKFVDLTETANRGLLSEMSIAEVKIITKLMYNVSIIKILPIASGEAVINENCRSRGRRNEEKGNSNGQAGEQVFKSKMM